MAKNDIQMGQITTGKSHNLLGFKTRNHRVWNLASRAYIPPGGTYPRKRVSRMAYKEYPYGGILTCPKLKYFVKMS